MKIAIIGAPGSGKTTLAAGLFYHLKISGENVEMVPELIKYKVYKNVVFKQDGFDILNTLEQKAFEETFETETAKKHIDKIICEAPLCNGYFYSSFYGKELEYPILKKIAADKINTYDIIIFVKKNKADKHIEFGRKENLETSLKFEEHIREKINDLDYKKQIIFVDQKTPMDELIKLIKS